MWLQSQYGNAPWAKELRPDRLGGVVFQQNGERIEVLCRSLKYVQNYRPVQELIEDQKTMGRSVYWGDSERQL